MMLLLRRWKVRKEKMMSKEEKNMEETQGQKVEDQAASNSTGQEDIFEEIFGQSSNEPLVATVDASEPEINPESNSSDVPSDSNQQNEDDSYKYWQSQADKRQAELDALKAEVSDFEDVLPIARHLKRNPELISNLTKSEAQKETEEKPVKPKRPADYDHSEALADPESQSAKYLTQREEYMDNMSEYMLTLEQNREQLLQKQQHEQDVFNRNQRLVSDLQNNHGYTPAEANNFLSEMSDPASMTLDNLVKLHKMNMGNAPTKVTQVTPEAQEKQALMNSRQEKLSIPAPIGVQPGASVQSSNKVEDLMMDSMIKDHRKKNPF